MILVSILLIQENIRQKEKKINTSPPEKIINPKKNNADDELTPKPFTGVREEIFSQDLIDFTKQKIDLIKILPIENADFTIEFDYSNNQFIVILKSDKENSRKKFDAWLENNYPLIPKNKFIFQ
jgi:hypothetical protein